MGKCVSAYKDKSAFTCGSQSNNQHRNRSIATKYVEGCGDSKWCAYGCDNLFMLPFNKVEAMEESTNWIWL